MVGKPDGGHKAIKVENSTCVGLGRHGYETQQWGMWSILTIDNS